MEEAGGGEPPEDADELVGLEPVCGRGDNKEEGDAGEEVAEDPPAEREDDEVLPAAEMLRVALAVAIGIVDAGDVDDVEVVAVECAEAEPAATEDDVAEFVVEPRDADTSSWRGGAGALIAARREPPAERSEPARLLLLLLLPG